MSSITSNGINQEIKETVQIEFNEKMQDAHFCEDGKIYTQNYEGEWVNEENITKVQPYGNFLPMQEALADAEVMFKK